MDGREAILLNALPMVISGCLIAKIIIVWTNLIGSILEIIIVLNGNTMLRGARNIRAVLLKEAFL
jgi:hypothetical protein